MSLWEIASALGAKPVDLLQEASAEAVPAKEPKPPARRGPTRRQAIRAARTQSKA